MTPEPVRARFDELIHFPTRLRIVAAVAIATDLEFSALEDALGISTSLLSKQLRVLAEAGYVTLEKRPQSFGRPRTWIRLTPRGHQAYLGHLEALRDLTTTGPTIAPERASDATSPDTGDMFRVNPPQEGTPDALRPRTEGTRRS